MQSKTITKDADWEWEAALAITKGGITKTYAAGPEMEVGDLGMPVAV